jgi:hypothetical protein
MIQPNHPLFIAKCRNGILQITPQLIRLTTKGLLHGGREYAMNRAALIGIDSRKDVPSFFGLGGAVSLTFRGNGVDAFKAEWLKPKDAARVKQLLGY